MTDMKKLIELVSGSEEKNPLNESVTVNISVTGETPEEISSLLKKIMGGDSALDGSSDPSKGVTVSMPPMAQTISKLNSLDTPCHQAVVDDYKNEPEPAYKDVDYITKDVAGGLNKPKSMHKHSYKQGDNPMAMEDFESVIRSAYKEYKGK